MMNENKLRESFSLAWILSNLDINISSSSPQLIQVSYGVFLISLIGLFCFINIIGYMIAYFLIQKVNYETKYPKLSKYINRYKYLILIYLII